MRDRGAPPPVDDDVRAAIAASSLRRLDAATCSTGCSPDRPAGAWTPACILRREGEPGPHLELVVRGFVRILVGRAGRPDPDHPLRPARRPARRGVGLPRRLSIARLAAGHPGDRPAGHPTGRRPGDVRARPGGRRGLPRRAERARRRASSTEIPRGAFAPVRQRVARHLLDLASERQHGATLFAPISQQQLAEAVGSVREVVVRVLRDLRAEGCHPDDHAAGSWSWTRPRSGRRRPATTGLEPRFLTGPVASASDPPPTPSRSDGDDGGTHPWTPGTIVRYLRDRLGSPARGGVAGDASAAGRRAAA